MPRLTNIGPPGRAKALMSLRLTGVNEVLEHRVVELLRRLFDEPISQAFQIRRDRLVVDHRVLLADFRGSFAAELDVLLGREFVLRRRDLGLCQGQRAGREQHGDEGPRAHAAGHRAHDWGPGLLFLRGSLLPSGAERQTARARPSSASPSAPRATIRPRLGAAASGLSICR